jgi:predicted ATP-grasp superfamily ATP-dependent carboligase
LTNVDKPGAIIIEGHVQGLSNTRSLGVAGIPVYVVDKGPCIASHSRYCIKSFICPDYQTDAFVDFLVTLAQKENISGWMLLPSNDHAVYTISRHKVLLSRFYKIITPDLPVTEQIYDKRRLLELAEGLKLPCPLTQYFSTPSEEPRPELNFPVITKGRNGLSFYKALGKKAFLAADRVELQQQLQLIAERYPVDGTFTQELIPFNGKNKTISFTAFCVKGEIKAHWMGVKLREHPLRFGTATFARSIYEEACYKQSVPLLRALDYTGVCEVEYLLDPRDGKYKLIEINARTWLWVGLARVCGVDYALMIYAYLNGHPFVYPDNYRTGINWINPVSDFAYSMLAMLQLRLNPFEYLKTIFARDNVNALMAKGDNRPFFSYFLNIKSFLKSR